MTTPRPDYNYRQFSWALAKVWLVFWIVAALLAGLIDAVLLSIASLKDVADQPSRMGGFVTWDINVKILLIFGAYLFHLYHQTLSALFATLSFLVVGRVVLWWMVVTAPLVVYLSGFSVLSAFSWDKAPLTTKIIWPLFFTLLATQVFVVTVCWLCVRGLRRQPLRLRAAGVREGGVS